MRNCGWALSCWTIARSLARLSVAQLNRLRLRRSYGNGGCRINRRGPHAVAIGKRPEPNSRPGYLRVSQGNFYCRHYGPAKRGFDDLVMYNKAPRRGHSCTDKDI